ncbi:hypothetical protein RF11_14675 [Thelohanellus kitauei]|uniref:Uncharacterized protein n=1 Tax=Thelohanellus kitauei TaxID=669202 RepID=A0A0C2IZW2_THEKT|nr:hypothetical protein RF11_14675 [Thelohanellus kitauei]
MRQNLQFLPALDQSPSGGKSYHNVLIPPTSLLARHFWSLSLRLPPTTEPPESVYDDLGQEQGLTTIVRNGLHESIKILIGLATVPAISDLTLKAIQQSSHTGFLNPKGWLELE